MYSTLYPVRHSIKTGFVTYRPAATLKKKWKELRKDITLVMANYEKSGQNEELAFSDFTNGSIFVEYMHYLSTILNRRNWIGRITRLIPGGGEDSFEAQSRSQVSRRSSRNAHG